MAAPPDPPRVPLSSEPRAALETGDDVAAGSDDRSVLAVDRAANADIEREDGVYPLSYNLDDPAPPRDVIAKAMYRSGRGPACSRRRSYSDAPSQKRHQLSERTPSA